jgi:signal transduction histidine kinase
MLARSLVVCAVLAALLWAAMYVYLEQSRRSVLANAQAERANLARLIAAHQEASMRVVDVALRHLTTVWQRDRSAFDPLAATYETELQYERVIQLAVIDRNGGVLYSRLPVPPGVNFADRGYFHAQRDSRTDQLHVSEPLFGRVTKQWAIQITRALRGPNGEFEGLIVVAVPPPGLERFFRDIDLGRDGVITLARADGAVFARTRDFERAAQASLAGSMAVNPQSPPAGHYEGKGWLDPIERLYTYQRFQEYPFVVLVSQSRVSVLEPFHRLRTAVLTGGIIASVLLLALGWAIGELRWRRRVAEQERERVMLELHDGSIQALYAIGLSLEGARRQLAAEESPAERVIADSEAALGVVMQDLRSFIAGGSQRAPVGDELVRQLQALVPNAQPGMPAFRLDFDPDAAAALTPEQAAHLLRIARETVSNIVRHARASSARLSLTREGERFLFEAADDGAGIATGRDAPGLGLRHIHARARKLHGEARVTGQAGGGTRVTVKFPRAA